MTDYHPSAELAQALEAHRLAQQNADTARETLRAAVAAELKTYNVTNDAIADHLPWSSETIRGIAREHDVPRKRKPTVRSIKPQDTGPGSLDNFMQEHGSDWHTLFCHPTHLDTARAVIAQRGWGATIVQGHRDVPTDTVWVNDAAGPLALPLAELGAAAAQLTPGGRLADAVRAMAKPLDIAGPGRER
jgi:hypothetical protein